VKRLLILYVALFLASTAFAQINISGSITDESGESLIGATIFIEGTGTGTVADMDGKYRISVPSKETILKFSFVGFETQNIVVGDKTVINVVLKTDALKLNDVIVLGYGSLKKSNVIGSISSVDGEMIQNRPVSSPLQALQGQSSGVLITQNSGAPGEKAQINIRGIGTINNSAPLYVVDGIVTSGIDHINPNDIESTEILKDASSAAIYGAEGANGVVIVNTKNAGFNTLKVDANYFYGVKQYWNSVDVMDRYDWQVYEYIKKSNTTGYRNHLAMSREEYYNSNPNVNWLDEISQTGSIERASISIAHGLDKINYLLSASVYNENGLIKTSNHNQKNLSLKVQAKPWSRVTLDLKTTYQGRESNKVPGGDNSLLRKALIQQPTDIYERYDNYLLMNPVQQLEQNYNKNRADRFDLNASVKVNLSMDLTFQSRVGYEKNNGYDDMLGFVDPKYDLYLYENERLRYPNATNKLSQDQQFLWENIFNYNRSIRKHDIGAVVFSSIKEVNSVFVQGKGELFLHNNILFSNPDHMELKREISGVETLTKSVGFGGRFNYSYAQRYLFEINFRADGSSRFPRANRWGYFPSLSVGWRLDEEPFMASYRDWLSQFKLRASVGQSGNNRINNNSMYKIFKSGEYYSYGNYYLSGYSAHNIGNPGLLWERTTTYNVGLDFGFMNMIYGSAEYFERYTTDMLIEVPVLAATGLRDAPLQNGGDVMNRGTEFQIGIRKRTGDFSFDINANISFITNKITKLGDRDDPIYGGEIKNPGIGNATYTAVGRPIGEFYGLVIDKENPIYRDIDDVLAAGSIYQNLSEELASQYVGTFRFLDLNGDNLISQEDKTIIGSPHPDFFGGLNGNFTYKSFSLDMFWQFSYGNEVFNVMKYWLDVGFTEQSNNGGGPNSSISNKRASNIGKFMTKAAETLIPYDPVYNPNNIDYATLLTAAGGGNHKTSENFLEGNKTSSFFVEDASYLRLKNIRFSYILDYDLATRLRMKRVEMFIGAENLLTFTNYSGLDPEVGTKEGADNANISMGIDYGTYPQARTFVVGVNLNF
jgi:TonB-dependent starch-binding outer membrane protein SusC